MKKIFIIDDSALMRRVMSDIINEDKELKVSQVATNGLEGLALLQEGNLYDLILLDINMPKMDGVSFLKKLTTMSIKVRVIVVSSIASRSTQETIQALELGAFDFIKKPDSYLVGANNDFKEQLLKKIHLAVGLDDGTSDTELDVIKKIVRVNANLASIPKSNKFDKDEIVFIACSTGGPKSLQRVIPLLPADLACPIVIVQHMPEGFTKSLASRLNEMSKVDVVEVEDGMKLDPGKVYVAKGGYHCHITETKKHEHQFVLSHDSMRNGLRPCADVCLESMAETSYEQIISVVLTGMGDDGTRGLAYLKQYKKVKVIGQDEKSCVVYGMPRAVKAAGLVDEVVALDDVARAIIKNI